jgi:hypothetical protein
MKLNSKATGKTDESACEDSFLAERRLTETFPLTVERNRREGLSLSLSPGTFISWKREYSVIWKRGCKEVAQDAQLIALRYQTTLQVGDVAGTDSPLAPQCLT